jgi:integrase/recombinase XerD
VRISDGTAGLSTATVKRRLAAVSSLYRYLVARGDVVPNPVRKGLPTRTTPRRGGRGVPWVRGVRPRPAPILASAEVEVLLAALRRERDRAMIQAMVPGGR